MYATLRGLCPVFALRCALTLCLLMGLTALVGCEGQQNINKAAFAETETKIAADEKMAKIIEGMEFKREEIIVYTHSDENTLMEDLGNAVIWVAQTMGDLIKANPENKMKELIFRGCVSKEKGGDEMWVVRYDFATGQAALDKNRVTQTM